MAAYEVNPARMALVNVDMQLAFVEGTPLSAANGVALLGIVNKLSAACRAAGIMVIHTKHTTRADGTNLGTMGVLCDPVREGYIQEGTKTVELHAGLDVEPGDIVLEKPRYGAFSGTDLDMILRGNDIDTIIVSGICTNICCETTAREAGMRDYFVFFMEDGTDTFATDPEHQAPSRIAFGSCLKQDKPQPIWNVIADMNPDMFLFIGDNIYADTEDMSVMRQKYDLLNADKGYQRLKSTCPVLAVWDDHDYGINDSGAD